MSHSPSHFIVRVSLAKRPRPMLQNSLHFLGPTLFFPSSPASLSPKKERHQKKKVHHDRADPPPRSPDCAPHEDEVTHAEINIAQAAPHSPMRPDELPVTNLFGGSLGFTLNKRQLIEREKSGHTPARKKHGHTTCRASSVRARVTIQEALSAEMSSLHVADSLSGRVELSDYC